MLSLIGIGLVDEKDMTLRGIEAARSADKVYCELYTGKWTGNMEELQKSVEKDEIFMLVRKDMEEESSKILEKSKSKNIAILVQGDPLVATTHATLLIEAKKMGIETRIIHNSSIFSAVSETGLHVYKFGSTVTLPFMEKTGGKLPKSVYDLIKENKNRGLHTLCLLDIGMDAKTFMNPSQASGLLMSMEKEFRENVLVGEKVVVLCGAGGSSKIFYDDIKSIRTKLITETPAVFIVPGKLHFTEEEFLETFRQK